MPLEAFHFAVNDVRPSLVRIEADEATYNLHILVGFELETALVADDLAVAICPAPGRKNIRSTSATGPATTGGRTPGHPWSGGLIGYFPTYTLGNLFAAQLLGQAEADLGGLAPLVQRGQYEPLRDWLRQRVHQQGERYRGADLVQRVRPASCRTHRWWPTCAIKCSALTTGLALW